MRLRLSVRRHGLPTVKLLWRVSEDCTTIAKLLEQVNEAIPLESDTWDVEDYVVEVRGYECLHYQVVSMVLKEDDKVSIRPLETSDVRARTASGRYQITPGGAKLTDGIAYGRSRIKQISRPRIRIPPRKAPRLIASDSDELFDDDDNGEAQGTASQQLRIESGHRPSNDSTTEAKNHGSSSKALVPSTKRKRSDGKARRVSFNKSNLTDLPTARFDIYEDEDEDSGDEDNYTTDTDNSSSEESDSEVESDTENREPSRHPQVRSNGRGKVYTVSPSPSSSLLSSSSSSSVSSSSTSSLSSDSASSISSDSSSSSDLSDSSENEVEIDKSKIGSQKLADKKLSREADKKEDSKTAAIAPKTKAETIPEIPKKEVKGTKSQQTPPGFGKPSTKARNERRKRNKAMERAAKHEALISEPSNNSETENQPAADSATSSSFEQRRQNMLDAFTKDGADAAVKPTTGQSEKQGPLKKTGRDPNSQTLRTPKAKQPDSHEIPTFSTPDDVDDLPEVKKPRTKLDIATSRRLLFGSLGVRTPKTKEDEQNLRDHFMKSAQSATKRTAKASMVPTFGTSQDSQGGPATDSLDAWTCKINLSAVECLDENVKLSAPPFPFVQRWDPQQQVQSCDGARGKKRKRRNDHAPVESVTPNDILHYDDVEISTYEQASQPPDLPELPKDVSSLPALTVNEVKEGAVIAFKKLEVSQETNWEPAFSPFRTAVVEKLDNTDSLVHLRLAERDRPSRKAQYDEEGYRIYGKFEAPSASDSENEGDDDAEMEIPFRDMVEPKLVAAAPISTASPTTATTFPATEQEDQNEQISSTKEPSSSTLAADPEPGRETQSNEAQQNKDRKRKKRKGKSAVAGTSTPSTDPTRSNHSVSFSPSVEPDPLAIPLPDSSSPAAAAVAIKAV